KGPSRAMTAAMDSLKAVESSVSVFDDNSTISRINRSGNGPVDRHLRNVYEASKRINGMSGGLFDPTLSPLIKAWGFGKGHTPTADTARIETILTYVGIDKTRIENDTLYKSSPEMAFNFSAIAKGYGVDVAAQTLIDLGCSDLMMEIGGEVVCRGFN
ncbi:MAG: FAD:protein FMN transferase, partial [Muribaculaceae bacterium]|nr:FAD:protein FMN transferase [Muribaculaceae bacterium]